MPWPKLERKHKLPACMAQKVSCQGVPIAFVAFVGAALASGMSAALALAPPRFVSIPFRAGYLPSVDPVLPA